MTSDEIQNYRQKALPLTLEEWAIERIEELQGQLASDRSLFAQLFKTGALKRQDRFNVQVQLTLIDRVAKS